MNLIIVLPPPIADFEGRILKKYTNKHASRFALFEMTSVIRNTLYPRRTQVPILCKVDERERITISRWMNAIYVFQWKIKKHSRIVITIITILFAFRTLRAAWVDVENLISIYTWRPRRRRRPAVAVSVIFCQGLCGGGVALRESVCSSNCRAWQLGRDRLRNGSTEDLSRSRAHCLHRARGFRR